MFDTLRRLIGWTGKRAARSVATPPAVPKAADDFGQLNSEVPLKSAYQHTNAFVRREAIIDRSEKIAGYEFSLLTTLQERKRRLGSMAKRAYDAALLTRLTLSGVPSLLGHRLAFVSLSAESLGSAPLDGLPPQNTVLMLEVTQQSPDWEGIAARLAELRQKGFSGGLKIHDAADTACPLMASLDFVQVDVTSFDGIELHSLARRLRERRPGARTPLRLVARELQSHDDFLLCEKSGFDLFQGPFITSRESLRPVGGGINRMTVLPILNMVRSDKSFNLIAEQLKNEPTLTYKLLRYLNSPAMGLQQQIDSLTQALVLIGREKFYRWMSLLLFSFSNPSYRERSLAERALTRGRTLELLAGRGNIPRAGDQLFLIGLFSLLDVALGQPLPELLEKATLPDVVRDALLGKPGGHADALALAILGDANASADTGPEQMAQALERCGIADGDYAPAAAEAIVWAHQALGDAE